MEELLFLRQNKRELADLITAIRFGAEIIAADRISPGATAAADMAVLAGSADAAVRVGVLQCAKHRMAAIDIDGRNIGKLSAHDRKETRRENFAVLRNEHDAASIGYAKRSTMRGMRG